MRAHTERPSDYERRAHAQERAARDQLRPHGDVLHVFPAEPSGAPLERDAAETRHQPGDTLMAASKIIPLPWDVDLHAVEQVARWAYDNGSLSTAPELLAFFRSPGDYPELHEGWKVDYHAEIAAELRAEQQMEQAAAA